ncbi:DNA-directed RNA polymerase specialized sigma subunit [Clostridium pascui]|uniref:hypothetical protein n=1 Tax=Clostridium pascui TaxID=46609 RepID=UPI001959F986|nr:hypothetical protein [Clostridium pascui]MBM7869316.1 DNA-directed RNA polymerase specialized sigma subunit [Clostridium pascui]
MNLYKKTEAILYNYKKTKIEIKNLVLDLEALENDYQGVQAIGYEERSSPTNAFNSSVENEIIKRDENILKLRNKIRLKEIEIEKVDNVLNSLNERDKYIIKEYYIERNQLKNISKHINLEESYLSSYKSKLIKDISNIMFLQEQY